MSDNKDYWRDVVLNHGFVVLDDKIIPNCRGGGKTRFYTRQHNPEYYADDPHDMEILEEVKEDKQ